MTESDFQNHRALRADFGEADRADERLKLAYIVGRFPRPTETFVLTELEGLRAHDVSVEVFPLLAQKHAGAHNSSSLRKKAKELLKPTESSEPRHEAAARWRSRAHYSALMSVEIVAAQFGFLARHPVRYIMALFQLCTHSVRSLRFLIGGLLLFPRIVLIARQVQEMRVTHLHAHFANDPATATWLVHKLTGLPYSFTPHGTDLHHEQHMLKRKIREAAFVVCISEFNRDRLVAAGGEDTASRMKLVRVGVETRVFSPAENMHRDTDGTRVLQVGELQEVKGQSVLMEACAELKRIGEHLECHFVGDGPDRDMLEKLSDHLGIADRVHFHGYCTPAEVRRELALADVLACPSVESSDGRREGIPVVLMEAMACGVPVIASAVAGIPELVANEVEGLLFEPGNVKELASGIQFLQENPKKSAAFVVAARKKVLAEFDSEKSVCKLIQLFRTHGDCDVETSDAGSTEVPAEAGSPSEVLRLNG